MKFLAISLTLYSLIIPLTVIWSDSSSEERIEIQENSEVHPIAKKIYFLKDISGKLELEDILNPETQRLFQLNDKDLFIKKASPAAYWIKLNIKNNTSKDLWVELGSIFLWNIDFYALNKGKFELVTKTGTLRPQINKAYPSNVFLLPLGNSQERQIFFIRIGTFRFIEIPILVGTLKSLLQNKQKSDFIMAGFVGLMLAMFFYNLFLYISTKESVYFFYVIYVLSTIPSTLFLNQYGIFDFIFTEEISKFLHKHPYVWINIPYVNAGIFTIYFLDLSNKFLKGLILFLIILFAFIFPILDYSEIIPQYNLIPIVQFMAALAPTILFFIGLYIWLGTGNRNARFYCFAWVWVMLGLICYLLTVNGFIEYTYISRNAIFFGVGMETMMLSFALGNRINLLRKEKEESEKKYLYFLESSKNELEEQVATRTKELNKLRLDAELLANIDSLTEILNRRAFYFQGELELSRAQRYNRPCSVIMFDIDYFKKINDEFGHAAGDKVLREFSNIISNEKRNVDIFGRLGGEEFAMILPETSRDKAVDFANRLRIKISEMIIKFLESEIRVTTSLGIAQHEESESLDLLLSRADKALYASKKNGRNRAEII